MKIWLVKRTDNWGYDDYDSLVVFADTEEEARNITPGNDGFKDQEALIKKTAASITRAEELSRIADQLKLNVLSEFWKEAARMLAVDLKKQNEAFSMAPMQEGFWKP